MASFPIDAACTTLSFGKNVLLVWWTKDALYVDFAKAFDSINHQFLLAKLKSSDVDGPVLNWIKSYLSNLSYQVQIDGILSEEAHCLSGVPQGSVFGPLLFLLYINGLSTALGDSAFLFADDVKMVFPQSRSCCLLSSLSSAWAWAGEWDLPISPNKCSCLTVANSWTDLCKFCPPSLTFFSIL